MVIVEAPSGFRCRLNFFNSVSFADIVAANVFRFRSEGVVHKYPGYSDGGKRRIRDKTKKIFAIGLHWTDENKKCEKPNGAKKGKARDGKNSPLSKHPNSSSATSF
jgi:hypothetical protein